MDSFFWYDYVGTLGAVCIILTFLFLQLKRIDGGSIFYSALNAVGASLILVSLYFQFNASAFIIEFFWLLISLLGIVLNLHKRQRGRAKGGVANRVVGES